MSDKQQLSRGLKERHVTMLSIGGVIGAGLFVGSGHAIAKAGPAVIIAYVLAGALVVLVMRMLGEMAVAQPDSGSFSTYADKAIGHWAGYIIGWLYWWFWVLVIPLEATAAAAILNAWFVDVPLWAFALGITLLLTITNLFSVKNYGEFEFWFALTKVVAIVLFIIVGAAAVFGFVPNSQSSGVANLFQHGGFMPMGIGAVLGAMLTTMFTFMGTEIVTIAAAESKNPEQQIMKATKSVVWRISLFYFCSVLIVLALVPWNDSLLTEVGSYQRALDLIGVPYAKLIIDLVVLLAVASCLNSALYTASRMLFSLGQRRDAFPMFAKTAKNGTPINAVLGSMVIGFLTVIANYLVPKEVFSILLATSGAIALGVYLVIAISQIKLRQRMTDNNIVPTFKMWCFPWLSRLVVVFIVGILVYMATQKQHQVEILASFILTIVVMLIGWIRSKVTGTAWW